MVKMSFFMCFLLLFWLKSLDAVAMATEVELDELTLDFLFYMTTNTVSKFHQNPSRSVKWFLYNSLHIYRELLLTLNKTRFPFLSR